MGTWRIPTASQTIWGLAQLVAVVCYVALFVFVVTVVVEPVGRGALRLLTDSASGADVRSAGLALGGLSVLIGAMVGFPLAYQRTLSARIQAEIAARSHITDRFSKAVELLGSDDISTRLGAIYAFERIAQDSVERDHWPIMETLAAFVRHKSSAREDGSMPVDIQAALTVIGRRTKKQRVFESTGRYVIDFLSANLSGADLRNGNFDGAYFEFANMRQVTLARASLRKATLNNADLTDALLMETDLRGARIWEANFTDAVFANAKVGGADFSGSDLSTARRKNTDFSAADISKARLAPSGSCG